MKIMKDQLQTVQRLSYIYFTNQIKAYYYYVIYDIFVIYSKLFLFGIFSEKYIDQGHY